MTYDRAIRDLATLQGAACDSAFLLHQGVHSHVHQNKTPYLQYLLNFDIIITLKTTVPATVLCQLALATTMNAFLLAAGVNDVAEHNFRCVASSKSILV